MAEHLASIFGTEKDRVNCPFYFKIGACRHGDRCSRLHNKPTCSQTLLMINMYQSPEQARLLGGSTQGANSAEPREIQEHYEDFCHDIFEELAVHGEIEELNVCDNLADHMVGNVYVKFADEDDANKAKKALDGRYYMGRPIRCEFSPVTDFRESTCRQYEENTCTRGGYCNFMHLRPIKNATLAHALFGRYGKRQQDRRVYGNRGGGGGGGGGGRQRGGGGGYGRRGGGGGEPYERRGDRGRDDGHNNRRRDDRRGRSRSRSRDRRGGGREYNDRDEDDRSRREDDDGDRKKTTGGAFGMSDEERRAMIAGFKNDD